MIRDLRLSPQKDTYMLRGRTIYVTRKSRYRRTTLKEAPLGKIESGLGETG